MGLSVLCLHLSVVQPGNSIVIPIARPVIGTEEKEAVLRVLESGQLTQGKVVRKFEEAFADWLGVPEAVAVSSGTAALMVALQAHGVGAGDEVITTPFSFIASANAILSVGAKPVFVDVRDDDFNLDPAGLEPKITSRTKAIIPVHLYGHPCRIDEIARIAERRRLSVIEDACQAHGASVDGRKVGTFGTGCFSFYPTKNMTTGEGGIITTNDRRVGETARQLRDQGQTHKYQHELLGYNWRMTEMAAAMGLVQLERLEELNCRRQTHARYLSDGLRNVITPQEREGCRHVYHQYTVRVPGQRDALLEHLRGQRIAAAVYYPMPIHQQPLYRRLGYEKRLPVAERLCGEVLSLPVHPSLTSSELESVVAAVDGYFEDER